MSNEIPMAARVTEAQFQFTEAMQATADADVEGDAAVHAQADAYEQIGRGFMALGAATRRLATSREAHTAAQRLLTDAQAALTSSLAQSAQEGQEKAEAAIRRLTDEG